jgi:glutamyl-tRNA synthetase
MGFPVFPLFWPYGETAKGYREEGYYPEAFINMLALLGWNPGTEKEIFSMEELAETFTLERVGRSGSRFDPEKAKWFNHQYIQRKPDNQLALEFKKFLRAKGYPEEVIGIETLVALVKERVSFVKDIWEQTDFFFQAPESYDQEVIKKRWKNDSATLLIELRSLLDKTDDFSATVTENVIKKWIEEKGYNMGTVMNAFRLVIVGALRGPHMFEIISWLGKPETLKRIDRGLSVIGK